MYGSFVIASAVLAIGQATSQAPQKPLPPVVVNGQPAGQPQKVCRWSGTGTMFPKRICMTPDEWAKAEGDAGNAIEQMRQIQHGARCSDFRC
jgi:hypothetical protein